METNTRYSADGTTYEYTHYSTTETAKLVRQALKKAFPSITFKVKSKKYAGGSSITVYWTDGPTQKEVGHITNAFEGAEFDGMIDLKSYVEREVDGKKVHYGADYIFTSRSHSKVALEQACQKVAKRYGVEVPSVKETEWGARLDLDGFGYRPMDNAYHDTVDQVIMHTAHDTSMMPKPRIKLYPTVTAC